MNLLNETFFITGVTGFAGAYFARKIVESGCEVHGPARERTNRWRPGNREQRDILVAG